MLAGSASTGKTAKSFQCLNVYSFVGSTATIVMDKLLQSYPPLLEGKDPIAVSNKDNILAYNSACQTLTFVDAENRILAIYLKDLRDGKAFHKEIQPSPSVDFDIHRLLFNQNGTYLAVVGRQSIVVLDISQRAMLALQRKEPNSKVYTLKKFLRSQISSISAFRIDEDLFSTTVLTNIVKVAWHPLSPVHLVVLTSDNVLRIYNVQYNIDSPEQVYRIHGLLEQNRLDRYGGAPPQTPGSRTRTPAKPTRVIGLVNSTKKVPGKDVVTFDFGQSETASWQAFTIYLLMEDGTIYCLCPVIPFHAIVPSHLLEDLLSDVQSELQQVKRITTNSKELRALEAAKNWLEEVQGAVVAQFEATEYERLSSSSSDEVAIALRTRKPDSYRLLPERVGLQGPLRILKESELDEAEDLELEVAKGSPTDLIVIKSIPTVLLRCYERGTVEALINFETPEPFFRKWDMEVKEGSGNLVLWETYSLRVPDAPAPEDSAQSFFSPPRLVPDVYKPEKIYAVHSAGVHKIMLNWLPPLTKFTLSTESPADALPDLPAGSLERLLNSMPVSNKSPLLSVVGVDVINEASIGPLLDFLIVLYEDQSTPSKVQRQCYCLSRAISALVPISSKPLTTSEIDESTTTSASSTDYLRILPARPDPIVKLGKLEGRTKESLQTILNFWRGISSKHAVYAKRSHHEIHHRLQLLGDLVADQEEKLENIKQSLDVITKQQQKFDELQKRAKNDLDALTKRAEALLSKLEDAVLGALSNAERDYMRELEEMQRTLPWYKDKIKELKLKLDRVLATRSSTLSMPQFPQHQLKQIEPQIIQGAKAIEKLTSDILYLKEEMDRFYK